MEDQHGMLYFLLMIQIFREEVEQGHVDVEDYGKVLKSGWGRDPPQEVEDWLDRVGKGLETLIY